MSILSTPGTDKQNQGRASGRRSIWRRPGSARGFTLVDLLVTTAIFATATAMAMPLMSNTLSAMRLRMASRDVARELQSARLRAVSSNRPVRVRFNCPAVGQYRLVELIGTPGSPDAMDGDSQRCSDSLYPYPSADRDALTRPNNDGPLRRLPQGVSFGSVQTIEFWPNGTAHASTGGSNPWPVIPVAGVSVSVAKGTASQAITVNGLGKIQAPSS